MPFTVPKTGVYKATRCPSGTMILPVKSTVIHVSTPDQDGFFLVNTTDQELTNDEWIQEASDWGLVYERPLTQEEEDQHAWL